jgi:hypothetical protein
VRAKPLPAGTVKFEYTLPHVHTGVITKEPKRAALLSQQRGKPPRGELKLTVFADDTPAYARTPCIVHTRF